MAVRRPRPDRFEILVALCGLLGGLVLWGVGLGYRSAAEPTVLLHGRWPVLPPLVVMAGCELLRRSAPRLSLPIGTAALAADALSQGNLATVLMYTDLVYAAVLYGTAGAAQRILWLTGLATAAATLVPLAVWQVPEAVLLGVLTGVVTFGPASTGWIVRNHRDAAEAARLRAEQTALLAETDRTQAVTAERARVARELHDLVAGHLSAIAVHSTAALSLDDPATTRQALSVIRENSLEGLAEMQRLIGILRDGGGTEESAVAPTVDGLGHLVDTARAGGLDVRLDARHGSLPAPVGLATYRIVQESLTNALKHASPGPVTVDVIRRDGRLDITVRSPYDGRAEARAPGSGTGIAGMRERASLLGGTFRACAEGRSWVVRATLPLTEGDHR